MQDLTLLGHVAFLRHYAVQLHALAYAAPLIGAKLRQIAYNLDTDADELEKIASGDGLGELPGAAAANVPTMPQHGANDRQARSVAGSDGGFAECLDAIRQGANAALHWPRPQSD